MLKRVAVIGGDDETLQVVERAAEGHDVQVYPLQGTGAPPSATAGIVIVDANHAGHAMAAVEHIGDEQTAMLQLLADATDAREGIPIGASERVRRIAGRFAEVLDLDDEDRLLLERAALLRSVGKLKIPNEILLKKNVLDYDEWVTLKKYPGLGAELLRERGACVDVAEIIRNHHECFDGTGYPEGKEGENIPYLARVLKLVIVYCAMTSPRQYRSKVHSEEEATAHLQAERGKHFDPALVDAFIEHNAGAGQ